MTPGSAGPGARYQHLQIARMRAIEGRRFLVRAANDGVSAIIGPSGAVVAQAPEFTQAVLRGRIQLRHGTTPYLVAGNYPVIGVAAVLLADNGAGPLDSAPPEYHLGEVKLAQGSALHGTFARSGSVYSMPPNTWHSCFEDVCYVNGSCQLQVRSHRNQRPGAVGLLAHRCNGGPACNRSRASGSHCFSSRTSHRHRWSPACRTSPHWWNTTAPRWSMCRSPKAGRRRRPRGPQGADPSDPFNEFFRRFGIPNPNGQGGGSNAAMLRQRMARVRVSS